MTTLLHRTHLLERASDAADRSVRVVASTAAIDSYDEIVDQDWNLDRYRKNPVVLYAHNAVGLLGPLKAEDTLPIGHASDVAVVGGQLEATIRFASAAANPMAEKVYQGVREKTIRGVSVGFRPRGRVAETRDGREIVRLRSPELFEISICPIGANPEAVIRALRLANALPKPARTAPVSAESMLANIPPRLRAEAESILRREQPEAFAECSHEFTMGECPTWGCSHHHMTAERRAHAAELRRGWTPKPSTPAPAPERERELSLLELCAEPLPEPDADVLAVLSAGCSPAPAEPQEMRRAHEPDGLAALALEDIDAPTEPDAAPADLADMANDGDVIPPTPIDDTDIPDDAA
ncbi:MAG: HK97 family phage prohead protease [Polyangiaceae bacterium]|nr:HK97 family phage prohead protease [Polyangiaceae bacterium]MCL4748907.1 HK97 family phage prohead protease [Myxococcales bacterium]